MIINGRVLYNIEIQIPKDIQFDVVKLWVKKHQDIVRILLENPMANCPFPFTCDVFPCNNLTCDADHLSNGRPGRIS